ncbi:MAG: NAD(P)-binding domain-containing protein [Dehalococcoidia bacterium]
MVATIGYGNLGRSMALNLRDSAVDVIVGNRDDDYAARARTDGFYALELSEAASQCDIAYVLLPDEVVPTVFTDLMRALKKGSMVVFPSGYNLAFGLVELRADLDACLLAPRMVGEEVRELYERREGFFTYVNVEQDASGVAWERLLGLAFACGSLQKGAMQIDARQEAMLDLFIEQGVGAYFGSAIQIAFQLGVEAGLPPEAMVMEMYMSGEMERTIRSFAEQGFYRSVANHGPTAQFGGFVRSLELDRAAIEKHMRQTLEKIRDGSFAREFQAEMDQGYPRLKVVRSVIESDNPQTAAEESLRAAVKRYEA